ncbi:MAG: SigE family RNA polymerase sigma factor [Actinocatenispora sp.]
MRQDPIDFATFYQEARDGCLRAVLVRVGDLEKAQDLVAEAFARAWARWRKVGKHPAPRAWVVRTALNAHTSWWRRRRREVAVDEPVLDQAGAEPADPVDPTIMAALRRLPDRQREVVALRIFLDLDTAGTAEVLGIRPGTVTAHLARAMATLRDELTPSPTTGEPTCVTTT